MGALGSCLSLIMSLAIMVALAWQFRSWERCHIRRLLPSGCKPGIPTPHLRLFQFKCKCGIPCQMDRKFCRCCQRTYLSVCADLILKKISTVCVLGLGPFTVQPGRLSEESIGRLVSHSFPQAVYYKGRCTLPLIKMDTYVSSHKQRSSMVSCASERPRMLSLVLLVDLSVEGTMMPAGPCIK